MRVRKRLKDKKYLAVVSTEEKKIKVGADDNWGLLAEIISAISQLTGKKPEELLYLNAS